MLGIKLHPSWSSDLGIFVQQKSDSMLFCVLLFCLLGIFKWDKEHEVVGIGRNGENLGKYGAGKRKNCDQNIFYANF